MPDRHGYAPILRLLNTDGSAPFLFQLVDAPFRFPGDARRYASAAALALYRQGLRDFVIEIYWHNPDRLREILGVVDEHATYRENTEIEGAPDR